MDGNEVKQFWKREVKIGEWELFLGIRFRCVEAAGPMDQCAKCDLRTLRCGAFVCSSDVRTDGKDVIFKKG